MGLDVTAHRNVLRSEEQAEGWENIHVYPHPSFLEQADGMEEGWYEDDGDGMDVWSSSYSGYNRWREELCALALHVSPKAVWDAPERYEGKPFVDLINFSDCEGVIGPRTCAKLARDFGEFETAASEMMSPDDFTRYLEWKRGFEFASDNGCVCFH